MATEAATAPKRLAPLLSALFRLRTTIRQKGGSTSVAAFLTLWGAAGAANTLSVLCDASTGWPDWQAILIIIFTAAMLSVVFLYVASAVAQMVGRMLGGNADKSGTGSALAWGAAPLVWAVPVATVLLALRWQTGNVLATQLEIILFGVASIWSLVTTIAMLMEVEGFSVIRAIVTYAAAMLAAAFLVVLPIRVFLWQPFNIPSGAQIPTRFVGDYLFVSKYAYGYSRFSFPFSPPLFKGRILLSEPTRGDIAVFKLPRDNSTDYIKRVIGLPGDKVRMMGGVLQINGEAVPRRKVEPLVVACYDKTRPRPVDRYVETLPNGVEHDTLGHKLINGIPKRREQ